LAVLVAFFAIKAILYEEKIFLTNLTFPTFAKVQSSLALGAILKTFGSTFRTGIVALVTKTLFLKKPFLGTYSTSVIFVHK
jgi:hypothetical protein